MNNTQLTDLYAGRLAELILAGFKFHCRIINSQEQSEGVIYVNRKPGSPYEGEGFDLYLDGRVVPHSSGNFKFSDEYAPK